MIAKYILVVVMDIYGVHSSYSIHTQEFYSLQSCRTNAVYLAKDAAIRKAYCTEK